MKKFLIIAATLTIMQHLLLDPFRAECLAATGEPDAGSTRLGAGATVSLLSEYKNPVAGMICLERNNIRLSGYFGTNDHQSYTMDLLARTRGGLYVGAGVVADRVAEDGFSTSTSDTTVTTNPHDHGKHKGDKHKRGGKKHITINTLTNMHSGTIDFDVAPSVVLGVAARRGLFVESRVIFGGEYDAENRTSVGVRF